MISVTLYALSALGGRYSNRTSAGGAGIFGLAIGFGAQTLVRNVISGVFRIGECIESGTSTKATVEHLSVWTAAKKPSEEDRALADEARPKEAKECEADHHQQFASEDGRRSGRQFLGFSRTE
jgi:Mechanosensitive ion channel